MMSKKDSILKFIKISKNLINLENLLQLDKDIRKNVGRTTRFDTLIKIRELRLFTSLLIIGRSYSINKLDKIDIANLAKLTQRVNELCDYIHIDKLDSIPQILYWFDQKPNYILRKINQIKSKLDLDFGIIQIDLKDYLIPFIDNLYEDEKLYYITELDNTWGEKLFSHSNISPTNTKLDKIISNTCTDYIKLPYSFYIINNKDITKLRKKSKRFYREAKFKKEYPNCKELNEI